MTPEAQRIAIAEACGWTIIRTEYHWDIQKNTPTGTHSRLKQHQDEWVEKSGKENYNYHDTLPDYLSDLNAMHEAEKALSANQWELYRKNLSKEWATNDDDGMWAAINATAAQRAEAFLKTINLWRGEPCS